MEEWRNKREIRKATRPTYPVKYKNVAEIINAHESAMKDKNLGNVQNPTYPMDKNIGTNIKNVAEVTKSHESAKFKSTPDRAPADTLDLEIFDQLGNLKDKKVGTDNKFENAKVNIENVQYPAQKVGKVQHPAKNISTDNKDNIELFNDAKAKVDQELGKLKDELANEEVKAILLDKI